jgi:hypothetical protein
MAFGPYFFNGYYFSLDLIILLILIVIWDAVWKAIGLFKSAKNNQIAWFIVIFIFNTAGILPIIYLIFFRKKKPKDKNLHDFQK